MDIKSDAWKDNSGDEAKLHRCINTLNPLRTERGVKKAGGQQMVRKTSILIILPRQTRGTVENKRQGLFLEISHDGSVGGTPVQTANSVLELRSVRPGETVIKGVSSSLYMCVDSTGHLRGQRQYKEADCTFRELLLADGYTLFLSPHHGLPVSLSSKQSGGNHARSFSQFLPVINQLLSGMERAKKEKEKLEERTENVDVESDDPLGMRLSPAAALSSPGFLSR
ncbi:hypothetical protein SKAU_G00286780 [Synaphobranchus kaupii]|uniref:Fibroblast growth factor n=1 Tax=Synaphobranchus kaupii TaxID=118154 RepID=A0A9Q1EY99_SYNKA|nr:hypothetical protein SKAU_G00286780 [Synaphobranchus kaupii]